MTRRWESVSKVCERWQKRYARQDERTIERIEAQMLASYQQALADYSDEEKDMTERSRIFEPLTLLAEEEELLLILREWEDKKTNYRLQIEMLDGAWNIMLREIDSNRITRGAGNTFADAWNTMLPIER